jgi:hypothetical protein
MPAATGRRVGAAAIGVALLAVGGTALLSRGDDRPAGQDERLDARNAAEVAGALRVVGDPAVEAEGDRLVLAAELDNGGVRAVTVRAISGLPAGIEASIPPDGVRVPAGGRAALRLRWAGPDCAGSVPEQLLPDPELQLAGPADGATGSTPTTATLEAGRLDRTLRDAWRTICDDTPDDTPEDVTDDRSYGPQDPAPSTPPAG